MSNQHKDLDLTTSARQPSNEDFAQISVWIQQQKKELRTTVNDKRKLPPQKK